MGDISEIKFSDVVHFFEKQQHAVEMADKYKYLLYGGSAGPGKSYWLRWYPIIKLIKWWRQTGQIGIRAGLFCEDYPSLTDRHISRMVYEYPSWLGQVKESGKHGLGFHLAPEWGSGVLALRNLDDPSKYLSSEFALIAVDELTKNKEEVFNMLRMRLRWPGIDDPRFVAATNPGEIGHGWVKKKWIDQDHPEEEFEKDQFFYVKALPGDNPRLSPTYLRQLDSMPDKLRRAYRDGDWNVFAGQFFDEWDPTVHVIAPVDLPDEWSRFICVDYGNTVPSAVYWNAIDPKNGKVYTYRELYITKNTYLMLIQAIVQMTPVEERELIDWLVVDSAIAASGNEMGQSGVDIFTDYLETEAVKWMVILSNKAEGSRRRGWNLMREYLRVHMLPDGTRQTKWQIFKECANLIRTIPLQVHDEHKVDDLNTKAEDHAVDAMRYGLQSINEALTKILERKKEEITNRKKYGILTAEELFKKVEAEA